MVLYVGDENANYVDTTNETPSSNTEGYYMELRGG